jgi:hypothetical protein
MPKPSPAPKPDPMAGIVDRLLAQLPGLQSEAAPSARSHPAGQWTSPAKAVSYAGSVSQHSLIGVWLRVLLGIMLGTTIAWWPYPRSCGFPLTMYFGAILTIVLAGAWAATSSWRYRASLAHVISLILMFYGTLLGMAELLPRSGYAVDHATWQCSEPARAFDPVNASMSSR